MFTRTFLCLSKKRVPPASNGVARRTFFLIAPTVYLLTLLSIPANADFNYEKDHWYGQSYAGLRGEFSHCVMSLHNKEKQILLIKLGADDQLALGISDLSWNLNDREVAETEVIFDHQRLFRGRSRAISKDVFYLSLSRTTESLQKMRLAKAALFQLKGKSIFFDLEGVQAAVGALVTCVRQGRLNLKET